MDIYKVHFDIGFGGLTLIKGSWGVRKQNKICTSYLKSFESILMEFSMLQRHVGLMNIILPLSHVISIRGREPFSSQWLDLKVKKEKKKILSISCIQTNPDWFLSNFVWW